jgi:hypothetical protein
MGRAATALGTADRRPSILDRSGRAFLQGGGSTGDPCRGTPGAGPVLSQAAQGPRQTPPLEATLAGRDVALHEIWFQLALPDRQRFGHRFSGMVLKALGLRPCSMQEAET